MNTNEKWYYWDQQVTCLVCTPTTWSLASHQGQLLSCFLHWSHYWDLRLPQKCHCELQDTHSLHPPSGAMFVTQTSWPLSRLTAKALPRVVVPKTKSPASVISLLTCQADCSAKSVVLLNSRRIDPCWSSGRGSCPDQLQFHQQKCCDIGPWDHGKSRPTSDWSMLRVYCQRLSRDFPEHVAMGGLHFDPELVPAKTGHCRKSPGKCHPPKHPLPSGPSAPKRSKSTGPKPCQIGKSMKMPSQLPQLKRFFINTKTWSQNKEA